MTLNPSPHRNFHGELPPPSQAVEHLPSGFMTRFGIAFSVFCGLLATLAVVFLTALSAEPYPSATQWRDAAIAASANLIPAGSQRCGVTGLHEDASPAIACVNAALRRGQPFWFLSAGQGDDSQAWSLLVGAANGVMSVVELD